MPQIIVDAGSGYSRLALYEGAVPQPCLVESARRLPGPNLSTVIRENRDVEFLTTLQQTLSEMSISPSSNAQIFIGATAGVRSALDDGTVRPVEIERFSAAVSDFFGGAASFAVVGGEEEAMYEHASALRAVTGAGLLPPGRRMGLVSSGGMSSQVVFERRGGGGMRALSLPTVLKREGNARCLESAGVRKGLESYARYLEVGAGLDEIGDDVEDGLFVCIEMLSKVGEVAGIMRKVVPVAEAVEKVERGLAEWMLAAEAKEGAGEEEMTWRDVVDGVLCVQALALLRALPGGSDVYFCREFDLPEEEGGGLVKATWGQGKAISLMEERRGVKEGWEADEGWDAEEAMAA